MKEKVVFDTNFLFNKSASSFFGSREELNRFSKLADIILPEIVLEELEAKYHRLFTDDKEKFFKTILPNIIEHNTNEIVIEDKISCLIENESIPFSIIKLTNFNVLPEIKKLAINKTSPFEASEGTDKGFKDAYIYFTVLEYLQNIDAKYIFVCSKDKRFKKAFELHSNILAIESFDEFKQYSISQFYNEYFINRVNEELGITISKENIKDTWDNINDNKVVLIEFDGTEYVIESDQSEIVSYSTKNEYIPNIELLITSPNFDNTDEVVDRLMPFMAYFTDDEIYNILNAACNNSQIRWIIEKADIQELIGVLYENRKELIDDPEVANFLKAKFG